MKNKNLFFVDFVIPGFIAAITLWLLRTLVPYYFIQLYDKNITNENN